jgi:hypothetical protein
VQRCNAMRLVLRIVRMRGIFGVGCVMLMGELFASLNLERGRVC